MTLITVKLIARSGKPIKDIKIDSEVISSLPVGWASIGRRHRPRLLSLLQDTVAELKKRFHAVSNKYYPARQRYTLPLKEGQKSGEALKDSAKLSDYGLTDGSVLHFKDLGTQVPF